MVMCKHDAINITAEYLPGLKNGTWMTLEDRVGLSFASHGFGVRKGDRRHAQAVGVTEDIACQDGCRGR